MVCFSYLSCGIYAFLCCSSCFDSLLITYWKKCVLKINCSDHTGRMSYAKHITWSQEEMFMYKKVFQIPYAKICIKKRKEKEISIKMNRSKN